MANPRLRNRLNLLKHYVLGHSDVAGTGPMKVTTESTAKCNLFCPMCPREEIDKPPVNMDLGMFERMVDESGRLLEYITPYGLGEPFLNPQIFDMIRYCKDRGIKVGLSSNATILPDKMCRKIIESGLDYLIFAVDGTTPQVYAKYRKGGDYGTVCANIRRFLQVKQELGSSMIVCLQMVRLPDNSHQTDEFVRMWTIPGVDEVRIKEDETKYEGVGFKPAANGKKKKYNPCYLLWQGPMYVRVDGEVWPCCHAWKSESLGNLNEQSLTQIWNGPKMQALRAAHVDGDIDAYPDCVNCQAPKPRLPLILGSFVAGSLQVRWAVSFFERLAALRGVPVWEKILPARDSKPLD